MYLKSYVYHSGGKYIKEMLFSFWVFTSGIIVKTKRKLPKFEVFSSSCGNADVLYGDNDNSFFDFEKYPLPFVDINITGIKSNSWSGHFSIVKKAIVNKSNVAIKTFKIFSKRNLIKELKILKNIENIPNVIKVIAISGNQTNPVVIYSYHKSSEYFDLTIDDFRWWLKKLLTTLDKLHFAGIIHRDIKLNNILAHFKKREFALIDFGLADFNRFSIQRNPKMGCLRIKSPEMLIGNPYFDCSSDMWAVGLACLDLMIGLNNNWEAGSIENLIKMMMKYFGSSEWNKFAERYDKNLIIKRTEERSIQNSIWEFALPTNPSLITEQTIDLVQKMLILDPKERITAKEALLHPFFIDI
ncbi:Casein kinase II subunit alpha [Tritrichomonas foetus]|uniref:non-specific serine/threonine protein kinase n=1 Tax=Tritrichomonas foetus TaxID=1144522 RepID=A0A1J4KZ18_9EUKA|nr:Casein kinase II subunit alpha [Tritrichomonas foetus]|eukprot:OHT16497.1 Casein kinase II subunit alpha [Tritrichomonas foetus]